MYGFTDEQLVAAVDDSSYGVKKSGAKVGTIHPDTPPVTPPVDGKLKRILFVLKDIELGTSELLKALHIRDRNYRREGYIRPVLRAGLIEQTWPEVKHSSLQKYRLTDKGRSALAASVLTLTLRDEITRPRWLPVAEDSGCLRMSNIAYWRYGYAIILSLSPKKVEQGETHVQQLI